MNCDPPFLSRLKTFKDYLFIWNQTRPDSTYRYKKIEDWLNPIHLHIQINTLFLIAYTTTTHRQRYPDHDKHASDVYEYLFFAKTDFIVCMWQ